MEFPSFRYDLHPKTEQEKQASMLSKTARTINKIFDFAEIWLEEINKQKVGEENFDEAERAIKTALDGELRDIFELAKNEQWPDGSEKNARDFIASLLDVENENFLDRIDRYGTPEFQQTYPLPPQDALSSIEDEKTKRIIYLVLIHQNPTLFSEDPDAIVRPAVARLLSRLDYERSVDSLEKFSMEPEKVVEKLLRKSAE